MQRSNHPKISGFEYYPEGKLLQQIVDFDGPVGIAYERCIGYTKPEHTHDRLTLTFPRGASRSFMKMLPENELFQLDRSWAHIMPIRQLHEQGSVSTVYDTFALFFTEKAIHTVLENIAAKKSEVQNFLHKFHQVKRGKLLDEAIDRYFFARVLEGKTVSSEIDYLESVIVRELYLAVVRKANEPTESIHRFSEDNAVARALEFMESHLFDKIDIKTLVAFSRTSQATLFRAFRREVKVSPYEYLRSRRLDEARNLLKSGRYLVGDVALLVGYEDFASFSKAFKSRFKQSPSLLLPGKKSRSETRLPAE